MNKREKVIGVIFLIVTAFWAATKWPHAAKVPTESPREAVQRKDTVPVKTAAAAPKAEGTGPGLARILDKVSLNLGSEQTLNDIADPFKKFDSKDLMDKKILDLSELQLKGVVFERGIPVALINDQILRIGDTVSGFKVVEIRSHEVVLTRGLEKYTLRLFEESQD